MAKSIVHVEKLGSYDTFKAPWESEAGADAEVDKPVLKKLVYNLKKDLAVARDSTDDVKATLAEAETERDTAKAAASDGTGAEAQKQIDKLTTDLAKVTGERDGLVAAKSLAELRAEVLGDFAAENPKAAKYVVGTTKEELEKSLEDVKEDFGISDEPNDDDDDEDGDTDLVEAERASRTSPRGPRLSNVIDPKSGQGGDAVIDYDKVAGNILAGGRVFG